MGDVRLEIEDAVAHRTPESSPEPAPRRTNWTVVGAVALASALVA
jgi:hypothetical protein